MTPTSHVGTEEMQALARDRAAQIVDVRPPDAYNGWPMRGETRGGHIPGACNLPAKWTAYIDWPEIVRGRGLATAMPVVVYGYDEAEIRPVSRLLAKAGFGSVRTYTGLLAEWIRTPGAPLVSLPRYRQLVPPQWLEARRDGSVTDDVAPDGLVICHCHYRNEADFDAGHIPGAVSFDTLDVETPATWNRREPNGLREALEERGITHRTTVVLYGRDSVPDVGDPFPGSSAGQLAAMRCAFILLYAGVADVRVLNGGLRAWEDARLPVSDRRTPARRRRDFGAPVPGRPALAVDKTDAEAFLRGDGKLVDIRSRPEFEAHVSGYDYIEAKGRIPGALFASSGSDAYHVETYRNPDQTSLGFPRIARAWAEAGLRPHDRIAFFCGTGWRASEAFFNAWLMGWTAPSVYDGGWFEWSGTRPVRERMS